MGSYCVQADMVLITHEFYGRYVFYPQFKNTGAEAQAEYPQDADTRLGRQDSGLHWLSPEAHPPLRSVPYSSGIW